MAPPGYHLLVRRGCVQLSHGPRENRCRPAIDPLFRSAALAYARRVVGIVLSGTLDDGTAGLADIKARGGIAIVQDPRDALFNGMPLSAVEHVAVDRILPVAEIAPLVDRLAREPLAVAEAPPVTPEMEEAAELMDLDPRIMRADDRPGTPSTYGCPECGGILWELDEGNVTRFRCRVGHTFSPETLLAAQSETLEDALWAALRGLEEKVSLTRRLVDRARARDRPHMVERFEEEMRLADRRAKAIRRVLLGGAGAPGIDLGDESVAEAAGGG